MPLNFVGPDPHNSQPPRRSSPYHLAGLDGLRALAIIAVLLYHSGMGWLPAGFIGVQVFFVVSGYLITWLLLMEWRAAGQIDLRQFWLRRARRLLPALFVMIAAILAFAVVFLPEEVAGLRGDVLAAIAYVTNWHLIFAQESYFEAMGRPSLLQHLWSLAVEEQFYLLWPLVLVLILRWWKLGWGWLLAVLGAVLSALLMLALYQPDVDPSRVYYGTDTRAAGLLIGAALAFLWQPGITRRSRLRLPWQSHAGSQLPSHAEQSTESPACVRNIRVGAGLAANPSNMTAKAVVTVKAVMTALTVIANENRRSRQGRKGLQLQSLLLDAVGLLALGILVWSAISFDEYQPALYLWGLTVVALTTAILILVTTHPQTRLGSLLDREPLRWIGQRSYGIYLWYWPVFDLTRPHLDVPVDGLALFAMRLTLTVGLAALSFRFVETPIRRGALERTWAAIGHERGRKRASAQFRLAGSVASLLVFSVALGASVVNAQPPPPPEYLAELSIPTSTDVVTSVGATPTATEMVAPAAASGSAVPTNSPIPASRAQATIVAPKQPSPTSVARAVVAVAPGAGRAHQVTAIGDSVMLGAVKDLEQTIATIEVDAQLGRQVSTAINDLRTRREANRLGDAVVVHIGNNGPFSAKQFGELMGVLAEVPRVVIVNDTVPREWEAPNNAMLAAVAKSHPNVVLVDWHAESVSHPEYFWKDGIHLRPAGAQAYAELINAALRGP